MLMRQEGDAPVIHHVDELMINTQIFWEISSCFQGRNENACTTSMAIATCNHLLDAIGPHHPLRGRLIILQDNIIRGRNRRKKVKPPESNILLFKEKAAN